MPEQGSLTEQSTDLEPTAQDVLIPWTGEVVALARGTAELALILDEVRDLESQSRLAKKLIGNELLRRMDSDASWTVRDGDFEVKGDGPGRVEYDGTALAATLVELVTKGLITADAARRACEEVKTYKPRAAGINALKKLGGEVTERVEACAVPADPAKRRVTVKRRRA